MKHLCFLLAAFLLFLVSCQTCRVTSVEDALEYQAKGYETRVAIYPVGMDGLLWGAFLWTHHAQAQVLVDGQWKWVGMVSLTDTPTFSVQGDITYRDAREYHEWLHAQGLYY